jgi:predicted DNA-binding antitoxin AbrB/MazE fold protein
MIKEIEAVYEHGMIRPLQPLKLAEGTRLNVILIAREQPKAPGNVAQVLAGIAALPLESTSDAFSGRDHDEVLYPRR